MEVYIYQLDINFLNISSDYGNLSGIECKMKNFNDALINSMHSLALTQLNILMKIDNKNIQEKSLKDNELSLRYYNLGVMQEYNNRNRDAIVSYSKSKNYKNTTNIKYNDLKYPNENDINKFKTSIVFSTNYSDMK